VRPTIFQYDAERGQLSAHAADSRAAVTVGTSAVTTSTPIHCGRYGEGLQTGRLLRSPSISANTMKQTGIPAWSPGGRCRTATPHQPQFVQLRSASRTTNCARRAVPSDRHRRCSYAQHISGWLALSESSIGQSFRGNAHARQINASAARTRREESVNLPLSVRYCLPSRTSFPTI
jgi:hypothetical protein